MSVEEKPILSDEEKLRDAIYVKWKEEVGTVLMQGDVELATSMAKLNDRIIGFVMKCKDLFSQQQPQPVFVQPSLRLPPQSSFTEPVSSQSQVKWASSKVDPSATSSNRIPVKPEKRPFTDLLSNPSDFRNDGDSLVSQKQKTPEPPKYVRGTDATVNKDHMLIAFGRNWMGDLDLKSTRIVISGNSKIARKHICESKFPPLKAVCVLPNPDWLIEDGIWDVIDDFQLMIKHLSKSFPDATFILATLPIEDIGGNPELFQFNLELFRHFKDHPNFTIVTTKDLFSQSRVLCGEQRHLLLDNLVTVLLRDLDKRLCEVK